jgi:hypothetical protein
MMSWFLNALATTVKKYGNRSDSLTPEQQWHILETHPLFTGHCPSVGISFLLTYLNLFISTVLNVRLDR